MQFHFFQELGDQSATGDLTVEMQPLNQSEENNTYSSLPNGSTQ